MNKKLKATLEILDDVPNINRGGCGLSALAIYRWCKKNGVSVSNNPFVIICEDEWERDHNDSAWQNGDLDGVVVHHLVIEIGGELHDSGGTLGHYDTELRQEYQLSEDELLAIINIDKWNSMFDREDWLEHIAVELDIDLSDVRLFN